MVQHEERIAQEFTQKELMQHLLNVSQHTATREELTDARKELKQEIADVKQELKQEIASIRHEMRHISGKYDRC